MQTLEHDSTAVACMSADNEMVNGGYAFGAADGGRRPGRERWPGMIQKEGE